MLAESGSEPAPSPDRVRVDFDLLFDQSFGELVTLPHAIDRIDLHQIKIFEITTIERPTGGAVCLGLAR